MGHLVDAIKKLEQRRAIEAAASAPPARAKSTRKRSRRIDAPHPIAAAPRAARRRAGKPASEVEPAAQSVQPERAEATTAGVAPMVVTLPSLVPVEIAIQPIARSASALAGSSLAEQLPIDVAHRGEPGAECMPDKESAEVAFPVPAATSATIALAALEAAPAAPVSTAWPRAIEPLRPLRLLVEEEAATAAAGVAPPIWEIPTPNVPRDYRELAARLCSSALESETVRSVLVVGATVAAIDAISLPSLAVALSARGAVLWVDPRRRRPLTTSTCAEDVEVPGLRQLAASEVGWREAIRKTSLADVSFTGCGVGTPDDRGPALLAAGLERLPEDFSLILVDGGLAREATALAAVCQSVGLAVAIGHDRRGEIKDALAALADVGVTAPLVIAVG